MFDGFFAVFVELFQFGRVPVILCLFEVIKPEMFCDELYKIFAFSAFAKGWAVFAEFGITLVFTVAVVVSCRIIQDLVFGTKNTIEILI